MAMLLKKYTSIDIGRALFFADALIVASAFFTFGIQVGLYSVLGLVVKSFRSNVKQQGRGQAWQGDAVAELQDGLIGEGLF